MKAVKRVLNSEAMMKGVEVLVAEGRVFYIFYCSDETSFFVLSYSALNLVIDCEKACIVLSFSRRISSNY